MPLVIGFASGQIPKLPLNLALVKNITVHGIYWGSYAQHAGLYTRSLLNSVSDPVSNTWCRIPFDQ